MSKPPVFVLKTGGFGPSGEARLHFLPGGTKIEVLPPSSRRQATVHRTVAFDLSSLSFKRKMQVWHQAIPAFLVRVARLELAASWSQKDLGSYFESYSILFGYFRSWCDAFRTSCIHCFRMLRSRLWSKYVVNNLVC